jgi:hypothetical protein
MTNDLTSLTAEAHTIRVCHPESADSAVLSTYVCVPVEFAIPEHNVTMDRLMVTVV